MAIAVGTITVNEDSTYSGTGLAFALFKGWAALILAGYNAPPPFDPVFARVESMKKMREVCLSQATELAPFLASDVDVRIPANAIAAGVPSVDKVITGALE